MQEDDSAWKGIEPVTMTELAGYKLKETLHEGRNSIVHRAIRSADGKLVVLKILSDSRASPETIARFKREFEMTASLNTSASPGDRVDGVVGAFGIEDSKDNPIIIL